ncbi:hypothetical protein SAMN05661096_00878 [Marivirga sericea]|uniref:Uncharacterized protein n=1 Tax=Marivirga sericea TaxID=1028 RepID=A0A1X7IP46_9BACT|nr:hypothetical protein SAMN05661096_00878 [Marivirga sericea]
MALKYKHTRKPESCVIASATKQSYRLEVNTRLLRSCLPRDDGSKSGIATFRCASFAMTVLFPCVIARNEAISWSLSMTVVYKYYHSFTFSNKSFHSGFIDSIKAIFLALEPPLICFSRAIASSMS